MMTFKDLLTAPSRFWDWLTNTARTTQGNKKEKQAALSAYILSPLSPSGAKDYLNKLSDRYRPFSIASLQGGSLRYNPRASRTFSAFLINGNRK